MKILHFLLVAGVSGTLSAQTTTTFVPLGSTWRYLDNGSNQGTAWRATAFDDATWAQGPAELGYGDGGEATVVSFGPNASSKYITTYFRQSFTVTNAAAYTAAALRVRRDDGVVIYLNGTEVFRSNLPTGTITYTTLAPSAIGGADESNLLISAVNAALLVEGSNVLAVEMHQNAGSSSDLSFDMEFTATMPGSTPAAAPQSVSATEDTAIAITLAGTDPQNDPLTFAIATPPANGVLTGGPPAVTYTPNPDFAGSDSFTFTASDGTNTSGPATVTITVAGVNDLPVADPQSQTLPEDGSVTFDVSGSDVESPYGMLPHYTQQLYNGNLTAITDGLSGATWNADTGTLFLIRNVSSGGGHSYEYTAGGTLVRTITQTGFLDTEAIAWMYGTTYAIAEENNNQRISIVTIAPGATALDRTAAGNVTYTTPVGSLLNLGIEALCYDPDRDLLYYLCEKPAGGAWPVYLLNPQTGATTILCDLNATVFTAGVATDLSDMAFDRATDTLLLLSHESNKIIRVDRTGAVLEQRGFTTALTQAEMLALTPDRQYLFVGGEPKQFTRLGLPAETLTYQIVTPPVHGALSGIPPRLTYTPVPNFSGTDSFTFRVNDGTVDSAEATVTLNVSAANDPPAGGSISLDAEATEPTLIVLPVSDPDGDALTIQSTVPSHGTLTVDGVTATYTGEAGYNGPDSFTYTVSDGEFTAGPFPVSISVLDFNVAPVANDASFAMDEDTPAAVTLAATDAENHPLTWSILTPPANGALSGTAPGLTYTPAANYHGADSFTFRVNDGQENSNTATVSLTIAPVNDAPIAHAATGNVEAGYPLPFTLTGSDVDGDAAAFTIVDQPAQGTLTGTAPNVTYTADIAYAGGDTFTFTVSDGTLTSAPATVTVSVSAYNMPPVAGAGSATADEDTPAAAVLVASDPESAPLAYNIVTPPVNGSLSGTAPNLTYTPALNFNGADSFTWTASDASKTSAPATFTVTVNPVNDAPAAQSLSTATEMNVPVTLTLSGSDAENDPLSFSVVAPPAHGTLSGTPPSLTYTPAAGFTGADMFGYTAHDGSIDSEPATVSIVVSTPVLDNLVSSGSVWKYLADGSNQGAGWREPSFDDTAWPQGPAQLGYGDGDEATLVPFGPDANNRWVTSYFRHEFEVPNPATLSGPLKLDLMRDDGAVVFLNGTEVFRSNLPGGTISWNTLASSAVASADESAFFSTTLNSSLIAPGRNVLAVEVHQSAVNSSDVSFDLRLYETAPSITRGPYVQMTGTDRATVRWRTNLETASVLNYGTVEGALTSGVTDGTLKTEHEIHVTGLTPDTRYYYSAGYPLAALAGGPAHYFTTHPPADTERPYRFWVLGDAGTGTTSQTSVRDAFETWNGAQTVDGVLLLGDNVYETGTDAEYQTKFFDIYPARLRNTTFWPCFGNHDAGSASSATQTGPYYQSFTMPKFAECGGLASGTQAYYSFDYGNIHFVCLDSEGSSLSDTGAMAQWLQADLAANQREWLVAFWHHPPYSKGGHDSDSPTADSGKMWNMRQVMVPILESYGVDLLLFGHEHAYFRTKFVDGHYGTSTTFSEATMLKQPGMGTPGVDGPYFKPVGPNNGAVHTVAGSSGKLNSYTRSMPVLALNLNELGSFVLDVNGREMTARFLNNSGAVRDTFAIVHNDPPAASPATFNGTEDSALEFTLAATDGDSDPLTWEIITPPAVGTLTGTAPLLTFTPPADFHGSVTLDFRVSDGRQSSGTATVTLNIAPVNDAPLAVAGNAVTDEDTPVAAVLTGSDSDGDALVFTVTTPPAHGTLSGTAPDLIYTPEANRSGTDTFEFTVSDGTLTSAPAVFTVTVAPVNDAPAAVPLAVETAEDSPVNVTLTGTDADGDALSALVLTLPAHGTLTGTLPDLIYTPDTNWHGSDSFTFAVTDGPAVSEPAMVALTVTSVNDAPVASSLAFQGTEDAALPVTLTATDADGDALTFTITLAPQHGTLSGTAPNLTYTPDADWHGSDSFSFTASDGTETSPPAAVTLEITQVNDVPVASPQSVATDEDAPLSLTLTASDADGDSLGWTVQSPPEHGTLSGTAPHLTYTPASDYYGSDSFTFVASDGIGNSVPAVVSIAVASVNDAPVAAAQVLTAEEDSPLPITLAGADAEDDPLIFAVASLPAHGTLSGAAPDLIYTPEANWHGTDSFGFTVSDGVAAPTPAVVSITVEPVNDSPVAAAGSASTAEDAATPLTLAGSDADGDALSFSVTVPPVNGTLSGIAPNLTYTPSPDWYGNDSFTFTVSDGITNSAPAVFSMEVTPVNDAPLAAAQLLTTGEDTALPLTLSSSDADGDALAFDITTPPVHGTLSGTAPDLVYTPEADWNGADSFAFTASDAEAASLPAVISITVLPANDVPLAAAASVATDEDAPLAITLAGSDPDGDPVSYTVTLPPAHGTLNGTAPELTYTPDPDWNGSDQFSFVTGDGTALSAPAAVTIAVAPVNDAPLATAGSAVTEEDTLVNLMLSGSDADGDALTFTVTTPPAHGTLSGTSPALTYTPQADWHGTDTFEFTSSDGSATSAPAVVTITVLPVNERPVAAPLAVETAEDTVVNLTLTGSDADGDALSAVVLTLPAHGTLSGTLPDLMYTPDADWYGADSFTFAVTDGPAVSDPATVTLSVTPVNDAPVAIAQSVSGAEDAAAEFTLVGADIDSASLTFSITLPPAHGTLSGTAPNLIYTPDANWHGSDSFSFTASDGTAASIPAAVTLEITPVNDAPVAAPQTLATGEDTPLPLALAGTDADGDTLTFTVTVPPAHGTLSGTAPHLTYTPEANYHGSDAFSFTLNDGTATSAPAGVVITIAPVNDAPLAAARTITTDEDTVVSLTLTGSDQENSALTFTIVTPPAHGTLSGTVPDLIYTPEANYHGADEFTFTVSDGELTSTPASVAITATSVNDAPLAAAQSLTTDEDSPLPVVLTGSDPDGDTLTFTVATPPAHGTLSGTAPNLTYIPDADWHGSDAIEFTVSDGTATSETALITVSVLPVNDAPLAAAATATGQEDAPLPVFLSGSDADGDALTFAVTVPPAHGALSGTAPNLTYTPDADWHGADSFAFTVADSSAASTAAIVSITIAAANDAPLASAQTLTTAEDNALTVTLTGSDADGDALSYIIVSLPAHGTLSGTPPELTYTPDADWHGADTFTYAVTDGPAVSEPAGISIAVTPVNDQPVATAQAVTGTEDSALPVTLTAADADGDVLTFAITLPPAHGNLSGTAPNLIYTPDGNWNGLDSFSFTVSDAAETSPPVAVTLEITPVNDAPVAHALAVNTEVGAPLSFTLTGSDVEGGALTFEIDSAPAFGILSGTGADLVYTPNLAWSGVESFTFTVSDGTLTSAPATVTLTVAPSGPWQLVARTGHILPGAGGAAVSVIQPDFVSDAAGRATFRATAGALTGIWTEGGAGLEPVAVQGGSVPGVSGAVFDAVSTGPWAAGDGELLFLGKMLAGTAGVTASSDLGYWLRGSSGTALLAREYQSVPSLPAAARFNVLSAVATLEAGGNFAFAASVRTSSSLGITSANDTGIWGTFGSPVRLIFRENDAAPGGGGGVFDTLTTAALRSNGAGQIAFSAAMKTAGSVTTANRYGLWLWDPLQFGLVARGGDQAPGTPAGALFNQPQQPSLGAALSFRSTLATTGGGVTTSSDTGIWILENGSVALAAREGSQAPGVPAGGLFNQIANPAVVNREGHYTFRANLRNGGGVASANNAGIWTRSPFTGGALTIVARKGSIAPGAGTGTFTSFDAPCIASDGGEAFTATLTQSAATGVTAANDRGLWVRSAAGSLALALREGAEFTLAPGDTRIVSALTLPAAQTSGRTPFSDDGRLLVLLGFSDGTSALYHYDLP